MIKTAALDKPKLQAEAETKKKERKVPPYAEHDPSGRAKCKHSGEPIPKGSVRVALAQEVEFGGQTRYSAYLVLPSQVAEALTVEGIVPGREVEPFDLIAKLRENTKGLSDEEMDTLVAEIGPMD